MNVNKFEQKFLSVSSNWLVAESRQTKRGTKREHMMMTSVKIQKREMENPLTRAFLVAKWKMWNPSHSLSSLLRIKHAHTHSIQFVVRIKSFRFSYFIHY